MLLWLLPIIALMLTWGVCLRQVPTGSAPNAAGWLLLGLLGLLTGGLTAGFIGGWESVVGWMQASTALHTTMLLAILSGLTFTTAAMLMRVGRQEPLVHRAMVALVMLSGTLGAKSMETYAFFRNDYALASATSSVSTVTLGIAVLYLLGALLVALRMPRRAAPLGVVLCMMGLVAVMVGGSMVGSQSCWMPLPRMADAPVQLSEGFIGSHRVWPRYAAP